MDNKPSWTVVDETTLYFARTIDLEFRPTHGALFSAAFLDEFEDEISKVMFRYLVTQLTNTSPPRR